MRRPEYVGYDEATPRVKERKGRVEEELPRMQVKDHLGNPDTVERLTPSAP